MKLTEYNKAVKRLGINPQLPTRGNVPTRLRKKGDGKGAQRLIPGLRIQGRQSVVQWTLEDDFRVCEEALANGATWDDVDRYCAANCNGWTFGALYNFVQVLRNTQN